MRGEGSKARRGALRRPTETSHLLCPVKLNSCRPRRAPPPTGLKNFTLGKGFGGKAVAQSPGDFVTEEEEAVKMVDISILCSPFYLSPVFGKHALAKKKKKKIFFVICFFFFFFKR